MPDEPIYDPVPGEFEYSAEAEQWRTRVELTPNHQIELQIWWDEWTHGPLAPVLQLATQAFKLFQASEEKHRESLTAAMLARYRQSDQGERHAQPASELINRLKVKWIAVVADGSMVIRYEDTTNLFGIDCLIAEIAADGTFTGFSLPPVVDLT